MCFAVRHGMVGVRMSYRPAPANPWPSGARDVAEAT
jgi:acetyl esterase/lipase